jgi:NADH pyrophosphatase NudC (nudix superfamily)
LNFFWFFCRTSSTEVKKSKEIEEVTWVDKKEVLKYLREDLIKELPREIIELFS